MFEVRPDQEVLAYAVDHDGSEHYRLRFRDLASGDDLADVVDDVYYGGAWSSSCRSFFYVRPDKAMRPWQVWRHVLGTPAAKDELVFQEADERFFVSVELTRSRCFILVSSESKMSSEVRYMRADTERGRFAVILPRREGAEYDVEHALLPDQGDVWPHPAMSGWCGPIGARGRQAGQLRSVQLAGRPRRPAPSGRCSPTSHRSRSRRWMSLPATWSSWNAQRGWSSSGRLGLPMGASTWWPNPSPPIP